MPRREFILAAALSVIFGAPGCAGNKNKEDELETPTEKLGDGFRRIKRLIKQQVPDRTRRKRLVEIVNEIQADVTSINLHVTDWRQETMLLPAPQSDDRDEMIKVAKKYNEKIAGSLMSACRRAVAMREHLTPEEWALIFAERGGA